MSVYNDDHYLKEAIESIVNQTYTNFEFIIIDDKSTDNSLDLIRGYEENDSRIKVIVNEENLGLAKSLNKGIKLASGEIIARMDADDISLLERFEKQINYINKNNDCILLGTNADVVDQYGNLVYKTNLPKQNNEIKAKLPYISSFIHPSIMVRKDVLLKVGLYPNVPIAQDLFLYNVIKEYGSFANLEDSLIKYRLTPYASTRRTKKTKKNLAQALEKYTSDKKITEEDLTNLNSSIGQTSSKMKKFHYYSLISKRYLWDNYQPREARKHLKLIMTQNLFNIEPYILYCLSFFPERFIKTLYNLLKNFL